MRLFRRIREYLNSMPRSLPKFAVGDQVWAYNGQARVVLGMKWSRSQRLSLDDKVKWGWVLETAPADEPDELYGFGWESTYERMTPGDVAQRA
ncbi:hypothetical protein [Singulisphaera sp. PoT]|uniref:hypothetical protein n=1 Tax=Singulisphaera sp. PoT TaxID=3411797 RepID=UPI003BF46610